MTVDNPAGDEPAYPAVTGAVFKGMSLLDWFAGQALVGLAANPDRTGLQPQRLAADAYALADAMLKQRRGEAE